MSEIDEASAGLAALAEVQSELGWLRANAVDAGAWTLAWTSLVNDTYAEAALGISEGLDPLRSALLERAATLARGATQGWLRIANPSGADIVLWRLVRHHRAAWHAMEGLRKSLAWIWTSAAPTGASPRLAVTASGQAVLDLLLSDPLDETWTRRDTVNRLNALAGGLLWRD